MKDSLKFIIITLGLLIFLIVYVFFSESKIVEDENSDMFIGDTVFLDEEMVVATMFGKNYTISEILGSNIYEVEQDIYDKLKSNLLDIYIEKYSKLGNISLPTEKEVEEFYQQNMLSEQGSLESFKQRIIDYIVETRMQSEIKMNFTNDINKGNVEIKIELPLNIVQFSFDKKSIYGNENSKVVLIEFSDMQCPFCREIQSVLKKINNIYINEVGFYFSHFPLTFHEQAISAAIAAECANEQSQFNSYKDLLFSNQDKLADIDLIDYANQLDEIEIEQFDKCFEDKKYLNIVNSDLALAKELGLTGTPTIFIGLYDNHTFKGEAITGSLPLDVYQTKIDQYIKISNYER